MRFYRNVKYIIILDSCLENINKIKVIYYKLVFLFLDMFYSNLFIRYVIRCSIVVIGKIGNKLNFMNIGGEK